MMKDLPVESMPEWNPAQDDGALCQDVVVLNKHGLHARPSTMFFEEILRPQGDDFELCFKIHGRDEGEDQVNIESVFDLMSLGLEMGTRLTVKIKMVEDEDTTKAVMDKIYQLFKNYFNEESSQET